MSQKVTPLISKNVIWALVSLAETNTMDELHASLIGLS